MKFKERLSSLEGPEKFLVISSLIYLIVLTIEWILSLFGIIDDELDDRIMRIILIALAIIDLSYAAYRLTLGRKSRRCCSAVIFPVCLQSISLKPLNI